MRTITRTLAVALLTVVVGVAAACGSSSETQSSATAETSDSTSTSVAESEATLTESETTLAESETTLAESETTDGISTTFVAEVWADNWFALSVNGELVGEDSVPITTERSFNAETITFEATYPLTIAIEAKDFIETNSGLEYIGEPNQQMGDGGIIAQITDTATGEVVAVTDADWSVLVVHQAPLNPDCEDDPDPDATCEFEITETPATWTEPGFDTSTWTPATVWSSADVSPKDGYNEIAWNSSAEFIWGTDLEVDNTILMVTTVDA